MRELARRTHVAICASTGGPQALAHVLEGLPGDYPLPVLVVQHMSEGFTEGLVRWPSGDVLFESLARHAGCGAVAVVLSGVGTDGAAGIAEVRAAGGMTIAQDEATSAISDMPCAAAERGAEHVLPVDAIGPALARLARVRA